MDHMREGFSTTRAPYFDGSNYPYWKARMRAFLRSLDESVWNSVLYGWEPPTVTKDNVVTLKPRIDWTPQDRIGSGWNQKGINAIFSAVSPDEFRRISNVETAKAAWDTLEVAHEGTSQVKRTKLRMLATKFENLRMKEDETFSEFYANLCDIANSSSNLGDKIDERRLVRKVLCSLPERFEAKVTAIEESKDIDTMKIEELVGSIQTFEMNFPAPKKNIGIALKTTNADDGDSDDEELLTLARKLKRMFNRKDRKGREFTPMSSESKKSKPTGPKCFECNGFGHYAADCANKKKKTGKAFNATLSDTESDEDQASGSEKANTNYVAFTSTVGGYSSESDFDSDEEGSKRILDKFNANSFEELFIDLIKCKKEKDKLLITVTKLNEQINLQDLNLSVLEKEKVELSEHFDKLSLSLAGIEQENSKLVQELEQSKETVKRLTIGAERLDKMLSIGKPFGDTSGLGFSEENCTPSTSKTTFVRSSNFISTATNSAQTPTKTVGAKTVKFVPVCHHCGRKGHIRPNCRFLMNAFRFNDHLHAYRYRTHNYHHTMPMLNLNRKYEPKSMPLKSNAIKSQPKNIEKSKFMKIWVRKDCMFPIN